jgi:hypothetical protein
MASFTAGRYEAASLLKLARRRQAATSMHQAMVEFSPTCSRTAVSHRVRTNTGNFVAESSSSKSEWIVREVGVAMRGGGVRVSQQSSNDLEAQSA